MRVGGLILIACSVLVGSCAAIDVVALQATPAPATPTADADARGAVRVGYPEQPSAWLPALAAEPAAIDLATLWGLPLYELDAVGQLRPGLAVASRVVPEADAGWTVEVDLARGEWSDGRPVVAADVVATVDALRATEAGAELEHVIAAEALDADTVALVFDRPYGRWPFLFAAGATVLPAHILAAAGTDPYRTAVPVSGGRFRLEFYEPGLRAIFVAHDDGPLGAPALERVEVWFTPSYETALGLIRDRRLDAAFGYMALNAVARSERVDEVVAAAPLGGTWLTLRWREGGALGPDELDRRRSARDLLDIEPLVASLLGAQGAVQTSTAPGTQGPWWQNYGPRGDRTALADAESLLILVPRGQEAPSFTARVIQRDLRGGGVEIELGRLDQADLIARAPGEGDGAVYVRRDLPHPDLAARLPAAATPELQQAVEAAVASGRPDGAAGAAAARELFDEAWEVPLYQFGVAQVWHEDLTGVAASSWPGLAFASAGEWAWGADGAPEQRPPLDEGESFAGRR